MIFKIVLSKEDINKLIHILTMNQQKEEVHVISIHFHINLMNFYNMNCHFQGGIFDKVRCVMMTDREHPFEHEFFQIISHYFPFLRTLIICNYEPQKRKQHSSTIITFPHLHSLDLQYANVDYAAQFLCDTKIHLPCLLELDNYI